MPNNNQLIDFTELVGAVRGEGLEQLSRFLGERLGLSPIWTGRGPDGGKDLTFTEIQRGPLASRPIKWIVSCKDKAISGEAVAEKDLPSIIDKVNQHKAHGFLLITTTVAGVAAKSILDSIDLNNDGKIYTKVWDSSDLSNMLLQPSNQDLLQQFFPKSYNRLHELESIDNLLLTLQNKLPSEYFSKIKTIIDSYNLNVQAVEKVTGEIIWPYNHQSADAIDQILYAVIDKHDMESAVEATENIEYDAFYALVSRLKLLHPDECFEYLYKLVELHYDGDIVFNAFTFLYENFDISREDVFGLSYYLEDEDRLSLFQNEIETYLINELRRNPSAYKIDSAFNNLPGDVEFYNIEEISLLNLTVNKDSKKELRFVGQVSILVILKLDRGDNWTQVDTIIDAYGVCDIEGIDLHKAIVHVAKLDNFMLKS